MSQATSEQLKQRIYSLRRDGKSGVQIVQELAREGIKISKSTVNYICQQAGVVPDIAGIPATSETNEPVDRFIENDDGTAVKMFSSSKQIRTLDDAIAAAEIDTSVWNVRKFSTWTMPVRIRENGETRIEQTQQVRLEMSRHARNGLQESLDLLLERIKAGAPAIIPEKKPKSSGAKQLAVMGLFDVHFGKLCWDQETGANYDLGIAERVFRDAAMDLVMKSRAENLEEVVLPIGNDWLHIDNHRNTTTRGTPVDTDGRFGKVFAAGKAAALWAVDYLLQVAPVRVVLVRGNHDYTLSEMLCHIVEAYYSKCKHVSVDLSPKDRKYIHWHQTLLGLTHGDKVKPDYLPNLMATEAKQAWAETVCREWLIGHQHRERQWVTKPVDTHMGTTVRVLRSLAGADSWHYEQGFVGTRQAAEMYLYDKDAGYSGHWVSYAKGAA